jgi:hypothetical protein
MGSEPESQDDAREHQPITLRRLAGDWLIWLALASGIAACLAIYFHLPYVNGPKGPKQWTWPYMHRDVFLRSWLGGLWRLALGAIAAGLAALLIRRLPFSSAARRWAGLLLISAWGIFFVWVNVTAATPRGLAHIVRILKSPTWTSYLTLAQWIDTGRQPPLAETLKRYEELLPEFPLHARTHPPGLVLISYGLLRLCHDYPTVTTALGNLYQKLGTDVELVGVDALGAVEVAALTLGILTVLVAQLGVIPLFWLVRHAMRSPGPFGTIEYRESTAWAASIIWAHYPALVLMLPAFDLIYPTLTLLCIIATLKGLSGRPVVSGMALGLIFMAGVFLTFPFLLVAPMLALLALLDMSRRAGSLRPGAVIAQAGLNRPAGRNLWSLTGATVGTCFAVDAILRYGFGIHLMQIFFAAVHHQNTVELAKLNRTFRIWFFYNIWDFLLFAGMSLTVLALAWLARAAREWWRDPATIVPAVAVFPLMVLIVDLSHQLSAETARVWLFLAPGVAWAGAAELVRRSGSLWRWALAGLLVIQTVFIYLCRTNMLLWGF